jgi:hypothetical protein
MIKQKEKQNNEVEPCKIAAGRNMPVPVVLMLQHPYRFTQYNRDRFPLPDSTRFVVVDPFRFGWFWMCRHLYRLSQA